MTAQTPNLLPPDERVLSTLEHDGRRRWLHPRLAKGRFWSQRRAVAYGLIAFFSMLPWIRIGGEPLVLLDVLHRRFTLFGKTFLPTDTLPLAFLILSLFLTVFFITAVFGRVWCGWGCPQTVYLEYIFRPIQRVFLKRSGIGGPPKPGVAAWRYVALYTVYLAICAHLANTFLAYFVGTDNLTQWIWTSPPGQHPAAFAIFVAVTALMMFDFAFWREQMCIIACPYGRFQSVMLDQNSLIISYDPNRGEPRGKIRNTRAKMHPKTHDKKCDPTHTKNHDKKTDSDRALPLLGDCVDCGNCVTVCPTGIDIRDGLQMECIGCAQCVDACNNVMDHIDRPRGLIRYSSQSAIDGLKTKLIRPRVLIYPLLVIGLLGAMVFVLLTKPTSDIEVLRGFGRPFATTDNGLVENNLRIKITNRTDQPRHYRFIAPDIVGAQLITTTADLMLNPGQTTTEPIHILLPPSAFHAGRLHTTFQINDDQDLSITRKINLQGPTGFEITPALPLPLPPPPPPPTTHTLSNPPETSHDAIAK